MLAKRANNCSESTSIHPFNPLRLCGEHPPGLQDQDDPRNKKAGVDSYSGFSKPPLHTIYRHQPFSFNSSKTRFGYDSSSRRLTFTAGFPATTTHGSTSLYTLERAKTTLPAPTVTPGPTKTSDVTHARPPIEIGAVTNGNPGQYNHGYRYKENCIGSLTHKGQAESCQHNSNPPVRLDNCNRPSPSSMASRSALMDKDGHPYRPWHQTLGVKNNATDAGTLASADTKTSKQAAKAYDPAYSALKAVYDACEAQITPFRTGRHLRASITNTT